MSAPTLSSRRICATVAATSVVSVLVILCTAIGASPPTGTLPTMICRLLRRFMFESVRILVFAKVVLVEIIVIEAALLWRLG
ncbi:hypothetical protein N9740_09530, partial [Pseudomonadales bacterium]|nr:hypothetical protein [Pseudomonadales bacterium]